MRLLLANLIHPEGEVAFANLQSLVPDPEVSTKRDFERAPHPRVIATHRSFDPRFGRVIYLVRDPRDVAASQFANLRKMQGNDGLDPIEDFIERFVAGSDAARVSTNDFGSWGENAGSWLATRSGHKGFLLVRYEDLLADTARELGRVAEFTGLPTTVDRISRAIERSSTAQLAQSNWRNDLPALQLARIEAAWGDIMACLGYKLATRDSRNVLDSSLIGLLAAGALR